VLPLRSARSVARATFHHITAGDHGSLSLPSDRTTFRSAGCAWQGGRIAATYSTRLPVACVVRLSAYATIRTGGLALLLERVPHHAYTWMPESLRSRSTIYRWLKQLEDMQPALVAYGRGSQTVVRTNTQREGEQPILPAAAWDAQTVVHSSAHRPVKEASSTTFQEHHEEQARIIAEIRAQHDRMAQAFTSLAGELVLDVLTGEFTLHQVDIEDRANGNESPEAGTLIPRSAVPRPHGRGNVERTLDIDSRESDEQ
jgi:hypothetical protein